MNFGKWLLHQCSTTHNQDTISISAVEIDYSWDTIHSHGYCVFYKFRKGWRTHIKELDRFEWYIGEIYINCMVFDGWFESKSKCCFNFISDVSND